MKIQVLGQNEVMNNSFSNLGFGIILAIILVFLLLVMFFQSWLDRFITMISIPGALVGILWMLAVTAETINVVSLDGIDHDDRHCGIELDLSGKLCE